MDARNINRVNRMSRVVRVGGGGGGASGWQPDELAGLAPTLSVSRQRSSGLLWQDAAKTVAARADGDRVRVATCPWTGVDYTAPSDAARPVLTDEGGGLWSLAFDGVDDYLRCPASAATDLVADTLTVGVAYAWASAVAATQFLWWRGTAADASVGFGRHGTAPLGLYASTLSSPLLYSAADNVTTDAAYAVYRRYGASTGRIWIDGESVSATPAITPVTGGGSGITVGCIDNGGTPSLFAAARITALLPYGGQAYGGSEMASIEAYLAARWGQSPTYPTAPAAAPYTSLLGADASFWLNGIDRMYVDAAKTIKCWNADAVYTWADASGNGRDLLQATSGSRMTARLISGVWRLVADGVDDFMAVASYSQAGVPVSFGVVATLSAEGNFPMAMNASGTDIRDLRCDGSARRASFTHSQGGGSSTAGAGDAMSLGVAYRLAVACGATNAASDLYQNGVAVASQAVDTTTATPDAIRIGRRSDGFPWPGSFFFAFLTPLTLTAPQVVALDALMATTTVTDGSRILLADGSSSLLRADGSSYILRA